MSKAKKVLLADDEPNILLSLDFLMRKNGFEVFIARNGSEAMEIIRKEKLDAAVLDIMMPDIDGYQICSYIKSTASYSHCLYDQAFFYAQLIAKSARTVGIVWFNFGLNLNIVI